MENSFQTSFIPKKPIVSKSSFKRPKSFISLILIFLLIISIILSIGLFLYKNYLKRQVETLSASLMTARSSFEKNTIDELALFDNRTSSAKQILDKHIILSPLFTLLGEITIPSIQYTSFKQESTSKAFTVEMEGVARDYRSIALQSNSFSATAGNFFQNVLFFNLNKDKNNNINFSLKFNVNPELISYKNNIDLSKKIDDKNNMTPTTEPLLLDLENNNQ